MCYSNRASVELLAQWQCAVGDVVPDYIRRELAMTLESGASGGVGDHGGGAIVNIGSMWDWHHTIAFPRRYSVYLELLVPVAILLYKSEVVA